MDFKKLGAWGEFPKSVKNQKGQFHEKRENLTFPNFLFLSKCPYNCYARKSYALPIGVVLILGF
jgi:hypothetical protein